MTKINILVLERAYSLRTSDEFTAEKEILKRLFNTHTNSMIVRFDLVDSAVAQSSKDNIFGKALNKLYAGMYDRQTYNYASNDAAKFSLLGMVSTSYISKPKEAQEYSVKLDSILETVQKTAILLDYKGFEDKIIVDTLDNIKKGFVDFNVEATTVDKKSNKLSVKGIPELTIVLCTTTNRKEADIKTLQENVTAILVKTSISIKKLETTLPVEGFRKELEALCNGTEEAFNMFHLKVKNTHDVNNKSIDNYIKSLETQNNSILEVLHVFQALQIANKTAQTAGKVAKDNLKEVKTIADLIKLTCNI
jgi:hypothetical protein